VRVLLLCRSFLGKYNLPERAYIGPTSMDPELAFIMTNMAKVI
jgi:tRNA G10  N-methylase Trm11